MKIVMGADHRGATAVQTVAEKLKRDGHDVRILGVCDGRTCDYPDNAYLVGKAIAAGEADFGILICGTGVGMAIASNKIPGVRAAVVHDELTAQISRSHNNANVLCLSGDLLGVRLIEKIVDQWLRTPFEGGRHARRVNKIALIEQGIDPSTLKD